MALVQMYEWFPSVFGAIKAFPFNQILHLLFVVVPCPVLDLLNIIFVFP